MPIEGLYTFLSSFRLAWQTEAMLQEAIESLLRKAGISFESQVRITGRDRLDLLVGRTAVELKIQGGVTEVTRQLHRYAQHESIDAILLVTFRARHCSIPETMNGKPIRVLWIGGAQL